MAIFSIDEVYIADKPSRTSTAIFFLLCALPVLTTIAFGGVDNITWIFVWLAAILLVILWLVETRGSGGLVVSPSSLQIPLLALVAIGIIQLMPIGSTTFEDQSISIARSLSIDPASTSFFLSRLIVYVIFFAGCLIYINTGRRVAAVVRMIVIFGAAISFFAILQRLSGTDGIYGIRPTPTAIPLGPFVNQHHFAALLEMTSGVAIALFFGEHTKRDRRILLAIAIVIMGAGILVTSSRGGVLSFTALTAFIAVINILLGRRGVRSHSTGGRNAGILIAAGVLLVVMVGVVVFVGGGEHLLRGVGAVNADPDFSTGRLHYWPIALRIFFDHPILGAGLNAFGYAFTRYDTWNGIFRVEQAHNEYLQMLADAGILGLACVAGFIYLLYRKGLRLVFEKHSQMRDVVIGALAGCFGIIVHSFVDFPLRTPANAFLFLMLCAIATTRVKGSRVVI